MHPFARSPGGYSPGSGPTGPAEGLATRCAFPLIRTDAPHLKLMNGRLLLKMVNGRSEEHTSELQSLMRISYAVFCLNKKKSTSTYRRLYVLIIHRNLSKLHTNIQ